MGDGQAGRRVGASKAGRAEAAELIWHWREPSVEPTAPVSFHAERRRGLLQAAAGAVVGGLFLWIGWPNLARGVFAVAVVILAAVLLSPGGLYATLDRIARSIAQRVGSALMWALMIPLFYAFFLPFGLLFRRGRRDRLKRFLQPEASTYWETHEGPTAASSSHLNQY